MTGNRRWVLITAIAPVAWGSYYFVTAHALPSGEPFWGAAIRALPAGLVLMAFSRRLPQGAWWWRSAVLALLNVVAFFTLAYLAAQLLPSSIATSVMALAPVALAGFGWALAGERPTAMMSLGAVLGLGGVLLVVGLGTGRLDWWGVAAALTAMLLNAIASVLSKRWADGPRPLDIAAWHVTIGGLVLVAIAAVVEGAPLPVDGVGIAAYAYVALVVTALANWAWFTGLSRLPAGTVGVIGLLNPVTGILLGTLAAGELLAWPQWIGIALVLGGILVATGALSPRARPA
ncbi:MAG: EamA family transporter [Microbacteriaceae bacterium]|nr:EamA family transporter [Microbacteriaceae bacterium]